MDDYKVTHVSEDMVTGVVDIMKKYFIELVVSRGKKRTFFVIGIELINDGKINIGILSYIKEAIKTLGKDVSQGSRQ